MRKGIVRISPTLLVNGFILPNHWHLESIHMNPGDNYAVAVISGNEFPEVVPGGDLKECKVIVHKENITFEIKEIC